MRGASQERVMRRLVRGGQLERRKWHLEHTRTRSLHVSGFVTPVHEAGRDAKQTNQTMNFRFFVFPRQATSKGHPLSSAYGTHPKQILEGFLCIGLGHDGTRGKRTRRSSHNAPANDKNQNQTPM